VRLLCYFSKAKTSKSAQCAFQAHRRTIEASARATRRNGLTSFSLTVTRAVATLPRAENPRQVVRSFISRVKIGVKWPGLFLRATARTLCCGLFKLWFGRKKTTIYNPRNNCEILRSKHLLRICNVRPRLVFTSSLTFRWTADFQSMPATSAVPRCAASTPSKNRSPRSADRSYVPTPPSGLRTSGVALGPEIRCPDPPGTPAASGAARWG
jgi:hypothetical protein